MSKKGDLNRELQEAVKGLYDKGIIKLDKDIAAKMHMAKTTVSGYVNGKVKVSEPFLQKFEKAFELKVPRDSKTKTPPAQVSVEEYMNLLKEYNQNMTGVIKENLASVQSNLMIAQQLLLALQTSQAAQHSVMLDSLERIEKVGTGSLATEADRRQLELNRELKRKGKAEGNGNG